MPGTGARETRANRDGLGRRRMGDEHEEIWEKRHVWFWERIRRWDVGGGYGSVPYGSARYGGHMNGGASDVIGRLRSPGWAVDRSRGWQVTMTSWSANRERTSVERAHGYHMRTAKKHLPNGLL